MTEEERRILQRLKDDLLHYASKCLKIRTKSGSIEPFALNKAQLYAHNLLEKQLRETGKVRALILKGRQQGMSSYIGGRLYHKVVHNRGMKAFILTHSLEATNNLFKMAKRFYENTPVVVRPGISASNSKELVFGDLDSGYKLGTAENKNVGRSSTIQLAHFSECAFWSNAADHAVGIMQAIPSSPGTEVIMESTANGVGNYFHQQWQLAEAGLSDFIAIFIPWFWQDEYSEQCNDNLLINSEEEELVMLYNLTPEQLSWRRTKIMQLSVNGVDGRKAFKQEYPCIVGSQRVGTNNGIIPIKEVVSGCLTSTGYVAKQWSSGLKETICVQTSLGYKIECTPDHRLFFPSGECVEAQNSEGSAICLQPPIFAQELYTFTWNPLPCVTSSIIVDEDFALFLGFFMGDGSYGGEVLSFAFDKKDTLSISTVTGLIAKLFNRKANQRETSKNGVEIRVGISILKEIFFKLGIIEKKPSYTKRKICVPECIWRSPKHIVRQFLRGLFDSDGFSGYETPRIMFFSKHPHFVADVQLLLLGFGITSKRNHVEKKGGLQRQFVYMGNELALRAAEARLFGRLIGFVSERKNARVAEWLEVKKTSRTGLPISFQDKVVSLTPLGPQVVYDMEMTESPHRFDASGILVHNCNSNEAFQLTGEDNYIPSDMIMSARKHEAEKYGPLVLGVDPARFGSDRTAIIRRQGRVAFGLESYVKKDTTEIANIVHNIIESEKPARVFVDETGVGGGVVDRLRLLGHDAILTPVNAGGSPIDANRYVNKRAEMWGQCREWLAAGHVQIPDSDSLHSDLAGIKYKLDGNSRLVMEQKAQMKARGIRSCDEADSLCLTFALPPNALIAKCSDSEKLEIISREMNMTMRARRTIMDNIR